jgi:hypothetical protein
MTGIFRYVRHSDVADKLDDGWRYAAHLGRTHGHWSALMWWCCGDCVDGEAP